MRVILASGSPRRRELMGRLGLPYEVVAADVDETPRPAETAEALVLRLAQAKARVIASCAGDAIVVAADTEVVRRGRVFGKPRDAADAADMLATLAGRSHRVITGVAVLRDGRERAAAATSRVWLQDWSPAEIDAYVASGDPLDKAGAYGVQNERFRPVARLQGCRCNVVGFPLGLVARLLAEVGVIVPVDAAAACPYGAFTSRCEAVAAPRS